jgi:hypothetical protein
MFFKFIVGWLLVKENRTSGIRSLFKVLNILQKLSKLTESKKDDKFIEYTQILIGKLLQEIPSHFRDEVILNINEEKKGILKDVTLDYNKKDGVTAGISIKF